jgi:hypothetical protein
VPAEGQRGKNDGTSQHYTGNDDEKFKTEEFCESGAWHGTPVAVENCNNRASKESTGSLIISLWLR